MNKLNKFSQFYIKRNILIKISVTKKNDLDINLIVDF